MSERLADYAYDIRNSIPEIVEILQQKEELAKRVEELEKVVKAYEEAKDWLNEVQDNVDKMESVLEENERYKHALEEVLITDEFEDPQDYIDRIVTKASEALEQENGR